MVVTVAGVVAGGGAGTADDEVAELATEDGCK